MISIQVNQYIIIKQGFNSPRKFTLKDDIGETKNIIGDYPEKAVQLKQALKKIILDGRSTAGKKQANEGMDSWIQIGDIIN
ncbi:hypothetical protein [Saccharicrinis sp. 156]|uniref:hypothetical protein n=1 Tax=Saccharicrinis sp. 156 TaxID=3417574 RepID=UPI003D337A58